MVVQAPTVFIPKGASTNRPPDFDGKDFYYLKDRMMLFLEYQDVDLWDIIQIGPYKPKKRTEVGVEMNK